MITNFGHQLAQLTIHDRKTEKLAIVTIIIAIMNEIAQVIPNSRAN